MKSKKKIPSCMILVGGWHPTFCPEILEMEDFFDAVCLGEGELPFKSSWNLILMKRR
ncbi:MAG: hypothetical protein KKH99_01020 [Proteobacteria bacterium]|nr:hypothetical protein [Pseudomonadota bacterium]